MTLASGHARRARRLPECPGPSPAVHAPPARHAGGAGAGPLRVPHPVRGCQCALGAALPGAGGRAASPCAWAPPRRKLRVRVADSDASDEAKLMAAPSRRDFRGDPALARREQATDRRSSVAWSQFLGLASDSRILRHQSAKKRLDLREVPDWLDADSDEVLPAHDFREASISTRRGLVALCHSPPSERERGNLDRYYQA